MKYVTSLRQVHNDFFHLFIYETIEDSIRIISLPKLKGEVTFINGHDELYEQIFKEYRSDIFKSFRIHNMRLLDLIRFDAFRYETIKFIPKPLKKEYVECAVNRFSDNLRYVNEEDQTEGLQLSAIKRNGYVIQHIRNPSKEIQLAAVKQDGNAIEFIKCPSKEIKLAAVKQNGLAIQYIKYPSKEVKLAAVKQDGRAIKYIKTQTEALQLASIEKNYYPIHCIKNPTPLVKEIAVASGFFRYIN